MFFSAGVGGLYIYRQVQERRQMQTHRAEGLAAFEAGQYQDAVEHLFEYLNWQNDDDPEATYHYARALWEQPRIDEPVLRQAISSMYHVLRAQPDHPQARRDLLELHEQLDELESVLSTAEQLLERNPDDVAVRRVRATTLAALERKEDALTEIEAVIAQDPLDWRMHLLGLQLTNDQEEAAQAAVRQFAGQRERYPDDPRFKMLQAVAHGLAREHEQARHWLRAAAAQPPVDDGFARVLLGLLDRAGLYGESLRFLQRHADAVESDSLQRELAWRLFEAGGHEALVQRLVELEPSQMDNDRVALAAWLMLERDEQAARPWLAELEGRDRDPHAAAWRDVLEAGQASNPASLGQTIEALHDAVEQWPHTPLFHALLADAYAAGGETEFAMVLWRQIADVRPSWSRPHHRQAELLLELDRPEQAMHAAHQAVLRGPESLPALRTKARAWADLLMTGRHDDEPLHAFLNDVQRRFPGEPATALIQIELLAWSGQSDMAREAAQAMLASDRPTVDQRWLLDLAQLSRQHGWAMEQAIYDRVEAAHGLTPELVLARAAALAKHGESERGQRVLNEARETASASSDSAWRRAKADYLDMIDSPDAGPAWIALADEHPSHVALQRQALASDSAWVDRAFADRAINRIEQAMGEGSYEWRVQRARWLLEDDEPAQHAHRAIRLLEHVQEHAPHRNEARVLLAHAYDAADMPAVAMSELRELLRRDPQATDAALTLIQLQMSDGQKDLARRGLDDLMNGRELTEPQRRQAESLLEELEEAVP